MMEFSTPLGMNYMSNIEEPYKYSAEEKRNMHKGAGILRFHLKRKPKNRKTTLRCYGWDGVALGIG